MQIVINIPEKMFDDCMIRNTGHYSMYDFSIMIANGTPLPKGHGRLKDVDALPEECKFSVYYEAVTSWLDLAPTIIEADKEKR